MIYKIIYNRYTIFMLFLFLFLFFNRSQTAIATVSATCWPDTTRWLSA